MFPGGPDTVSIEIFVLEENFTYSQVLCNLLEFTVV